MDHLELIGIITKKTFVISTIELNQIGIKILAVMYLRLLEELHDLSNKTYVSPSAFAWIYCCLGEMDKSLEWFEKAIDQHDGLIITTYLFPLYDPLRSHPRYKALLRKMNLEP